MQSWTFFFYYHYIMCASNLHLINKVLLRYLNVASFLCFGIFSSIFSGFPLPTIKRNRATGKELLSKEAFTYLGNTVRHDGRANKDIKNRLCKTINAVKMLNYLWRS